MLRVAKMFWQPHMPTEKITQTSTRHSSCRKAMSRWCQTIYGWQTNQVWPTWIPCSLCRSRRSRAWATHRPVLVVTLQVWLCLTYNSKIIDRCSLKTRLSLTKSTWIKHRFSSYNLPKSYRLICTKNYHKPNLTVVLHGWRRATPDCRKWNCWTTSNCIEGSLLILDE